MISQALERGNRQSWPLARGDASRSSAARGPAYSRPPARAAVDLCRSGAMLAGQIATARQQ
jgi:hypothetical protein